MVERIAPNSPQKHHEVSKSAMENAKMSIINDREFKRKLRLAKAAGLSDVKEELERAVDDELGALNDYNLQKEAVELFIEANGHYKSVFEALRLQMLDKNYAGSVDDLIDILEQAHCFEGAMGYKILFRLGMAKIGLSIAEAKVKAWTDAKKELERKEKAENKLK